MNTCKVAPLLAGLMAGSAGAQLTVVSVPAEIPAGVASDIRIGFVADVGTTFDLGGIVWEFRSSGVDLIGFRWEDALADSNWFADATLPEPQTAWFGPEGGGPIVGDGEPFWVATLTVLAPSCGTASIDSVPLLVFESTTFTERTIEAGLPMRPTASVGFDAVRADGGRYVTVTPASGDVPTALLLTSPDYPCLTKYIDADGSLVDQPVVQPADDWGTVRIAAAEIVPGTTYRVQALCGGAADPVSVTTPKWGDVNRDGMVDIFDIFCVLDGFEGVFSTCPLYDVDLAGDVPDGVIDLSDILAVLDAFRTGVYTGPRPCE